MKYNFFLPDDYKIAIVGSHSCGKTSLVKVLSKHIKIPIIHEIAATFDPKTRSDINTQYNIMKKQIESESQYKSFLSDRSVVDNLAYSTLVYKTDPVNFEKTYNNCVQLSHNHLLSKPYDLLLFVDEILPLRPSPHRNFMDKQDQIFIYNFINNEFSDNKYFKIPILNIHGDIGQRIKTILTYLKHNI